jgi:3D (Asp-Asp-Asp) domain-containing protein
MYKLTIFPKRKQQTVTEIEYVYVEPEIEKPTLKSLGIFTATHYCPCATCCGKANGITATGTKATAGRTVAVDPKIIPYGTEIIMNGHTYIAEDCGGAIKGKRIDIFCDSHETALVSGVKKVEVFVNGT